MNNQESSFTLIELLVVIAVIGILAGILIVSGASATNSANDARRKADINNLVEAILIVKTQDGSLPADSANCSLGSTCTGIQARLTANGMTNLPKDPTTGNYYVYNRVSADDFTLSATMSGSSSYIYHSANSKYSNTSSPCISGGGLICTETIVGRYKVDKYTLSGTTTGTFTWTAPAGVNSVEYLVVAGGGGGGRGGGGAGGLLTGTLSVSISNPLSVAVGAGGNTQQSGNNSSFGSISTVGGGRGGYWPSYTTGVSGGSGGGGTGVGGSSSGGSGTTGQGNSGGGGAVGSVIDGSGGGGGAGGVGSYGSAETSNTAGGVGVTNSITGTSMVYASGGKGNATSPVAGDANTGNGGDGSRSGGAAGGSGIVIIKYLVP